jgi:hypothetical protein
MYTKQLQTIPNGRKIYQTFRSKMYQNWDFWYENVPSGNPVPVFRLDARQSNQNGNFLGKPKTVKSRY